MNRYDLEEASCDDCCKGLTLSEYYNQDGLCIECFKKWLGYDE